MSSERRRVRQGKIECLKITDKAKQDACTSLNEVKHMTRDDCDKSYK